MKLRLIPSLLIFISSYFPLAIIFAVKDLDSVTFKPQHPILASTIIILTLFSCLIVLIASKSIKGGVTVKILKTANKSGDMFTYTIPYMISFYNFNLGDWKTLTCLFIFMSLMFSIAYRTQNLLVNPVLALIGYGLFDCQFKDGKNDINGYILSKYEFRVGDCCVIEKLSPFIYFATEIIPLEKMNA